MEVERREGRLDWELGIIVGLERDIRKDLVLEFLLIGLVKSFSGDITGDSVSSSGLHSGIVIGSHRSHLPAISWMRMSGMLPEEREGRCVSPLRVALGFLSPSLSVRRTGSPKSRRSVTRTNTTVK